MPRSKTPPTIRDAVKAQADRLGLTAYALSKATDGAVSEEMLRLYLRGDNDLGSKRLDAVFRVLGLSVHTAQPSEVA